MANNPFPASPKTPGQQASRAAYAALESRRGEYGWWEKYLDLREEGWDWRKAVYMAWMASPVEARSPKTLDALATDVLGLNTSTIRKWRAKQPEIAARIETLRVAMLNSMAMGAEEVLARLSEQARANFGDFVEVYETEDDKGQTKNAWRLDFEAIKRNGHLVKALKETQHGVSLILVDSQNALITLARHHKLLTDKVEVDGWQAKLVQALLDGELEPADIRKELGDDVAEQLLIAAGLPRYAGRETAGAGETP